MGCENECGRLRSHNEGYSHLELRGGRRGGEAHKGMMGRALLKDVLACPLGLGLGIDIFQSDGCVM